MKARKRPAVTLYVSSTNAPPGFDTAAELQQLCAGVRATGDDRRSAACSFDRARSDRCRRNHPTGTRHLACTLHRHPAVDRAVRRAARRQRSSRPEPRAGPSLPTSWRRARRPEPPFHPRRSEPRWPARRGRTTVARGFIWPSYNGASGSAAKPARALVGAQSARGSTVCRDDRPGFPRLPVVGLDPASLPPESSVGDSKPIAPHSEEPPTCVLFNVPRGPCLRSPSGWVPVTKPSPRPSTAPPSRACSASTPTCRSP